MKVFNYSLGKEKSNEMYKFTNRVKMKSKLSPMELENIEKKIENYILSNHDFYPIFLQDLKTKKNYLKLSRFLY
jgi:hypothetical protein